MQRLIRNQFQGRRLRHIAFVTVLAAAGASGQPNDQQLNKLVEVFKNGNVALGASVRGYRLDLVESLSSADYDYLLFDLEHGPIDHQAVRAMMLAMLDRADIVRRGSLQAKVVPLIRIAANAAERNQFLIKYALDLGAYGVVVPRMETPEDMAAAVAAARYPRPYDAERGLLQGVRGVAPTIAQRYWGLTRSQYFEKTEVWPISPDGEICVIPMIETRKAVDNIDEILKVKGVSAVQLGPGDMAVSYGHTRPGPGGGLPEDVEAGIQKVAAACKKANIPCGIGAGGKDIERRIQQGFRMLGVSVDAIAEARALASRMKH